MNRVIVANPLINIFCMMVCAVKDATDKEVLDCCNTYNTAGTVRGWIIVHRQLDPERPYITEESLPCQCNDHEDRHHILVSC